MMGRIMWALRYCKGEYLLFGVFHGAEVPFAKSARLHVEAGLGILYGVCCGDNLGRAFRI